MNSIILLLILYIITGTKDNNSQKRILSSNIGIQLATKHRKTNVSSFCMTEGQRKQGGKELITVLI